MHAKLAEAAKNKATVGVPVGREQLSAALATPNVETTASTATLG
jgi:hypothetical protein